MKADARVILKIINDAMGGKGGGNEIRAHGYVLDLSKFNEALIKIQERLDDREKQK